VILLDENVLPKARRFFPSARTISTFPDAANVKVDERFRLEGLEKFRAENRPIIAAIGILQRRKGFLRLMEAARAAPGNWGFLFAGKISWDDLSAEERKFTQRFIDDPPANTVLHFEFVKTEEQINTLISSADLHYVAYEDFFHSSHIQVKAAHFQRLCLAGPRHLISERTAEYNLGWTLKDHDPATLIEFLARTDRRALDKKANAARFSEFARLHSVERLREMFGELIDSASAPRQSWR
jgi:hypothetical protein